MTHPFPGMSRPFRGMTCPRQGGGGSPHVSVMPAVEGDDQGDPPLQSANTAVITWWVGPLDDQDTVCETGEKHGPYTVTLDANGRPVSVDTGWVELTQRSKDWYNAGQFSMCIQMEATVAGTMSIESLAMDLVPQKP